MKAVLEEHQRLQERQRLEAENRQLQAQQIAATQAMEEQRRQIEATRIQYLQEYERQQKEREEAERRHKELQEQVRWITKGASPTQPTAPATSSVQYTAPSTGVQSKGHGTVMPHLPQVRQGPSGHQVVSSSRLQTPPLTYISEPSDYHSSPLHGYKRPPVEHREPPVVGRTSTCTCDMWRQVGPETFVRIPCPDHPRTTTSEGGSSIRSYGSGLYEAEIEEDTFRQDLNTDIHQMDIETMAEELERTKREFAETNQLLAQQAAATAELRLAREREVEEHSKWLENNPAYRGVTTPPGPEQWDPTQAQSSSRIPGPRGPPPAPKGLFSGPPLELSKGPAPQYRPPLEELTNKFNLLLNHWSH